MKKEELQINNTFQIVEEFKGGKFIPRPWRQPYVSKYNRPGRVKTYTPEEIFLYKLEQVKPNTFYGN